MSMETIRFNSQITLGQFLKRQGIIGSGGEAKIFLREMPVLLNNEPENRRGKKLFHGDELDLGEIGLFKIEYDA